MERVGMRNVFLITMCFIFVMSLTASAAYAQESLAKDTSSASDTKVSVILVAGAAGTDEYAQQFLDWGERWKAVVKKTPIEFTRIGGTVDDVQPRDQLKAAIEKINTAGVKPLWIVLIGHGTSSRQVAKFNLQGPDLSAQELAEWLKPIKRPIVIVNCASCSGPFINRLSGKNRIVVTATKSGAEYNFTRFGDYFSKAIASIDSDLDHDDEVSVHEAFIRASGEVKQFYEAEGRIMSEHALMDDNGDGRGSAAKMFRGVRAIGQAKDGAKLDGKLATKVTLSPTEKSIVLNDEELRQRETLELQLDNLRMKKNELDAAEYQSLVEPILIKLAKIYQAAELRHGD